MECSYGPYWIGNNATGSYTFTFSPAIPEVRVSLVSINDFPPFGTEELSFEVNGIFYPITNPGMSDTCSVPAIISPTGTIRAAPGSKGVGSSWKDVIITETINSLTIENIWLSGSPNGTIVQLLICCLGCPTDAGTMLEQTLHACINVPATLTHNADEVLDNDDLLQFILFSDPSDTLGSIIVTSNTPAFIFNPATMQTGVTYYVAAIAGNNVGGNVDLNDPCFDISNAAQLIWHPLPEVELQTDNSDVCPGGCRTLTATLTGTPPFTLTVTSPAGTTTLTIQDNTGTFEICPPIGTPPGSFTVQATALTDAYCACP